MRKALVHLLMLLMLLPGLACGPIMHAGKAQAAQSPMPGMEHCQGMGMDSAKKNPAGDEPMFFKDCLHVDLQNATPHADLKSPDLSGKTFVVAWIDTVPATSFIPVGFHAIRGPPPDWPGLSRTQPSILLSTQRLRV